MKKIKLLIVFLLIWTTSFSQIVFNKILEDTLNHVACGVIDIDTGYIVVTGSRNEFFIRCFALRYIGNNGNYNWKRTYTDDVNELWEGKDNFKSDCGILYLAGTKKNTITGEIGVFINTFDNCLDLNTNFILLEDIGWKQALNQICTENFYYIVGQYHIETEDKYSSMLIKSDINGNLIWKKLYGSIAEGSSTIFKNYENNLIIGGITGSFSPPFNNSKWYIIKADTAGNLIWEKAFGHNSRNNGGIKDLIETSDSNILACGVYPAAKYGSGNDQYLFDGCLRKIDFGGNLLWEKYYRSYILSHTGHIYFQNNIYSVCEKNEHLYVLGWNYGYVSWKDRAYLTKMDKNGNILWKREYYAIDTNSYSQWLVSFKPTNDNGFILAGYGNEYNTHGYDPPQQAWLVKTDSLGMDGLCNIEPDELNFDFDIIEVPEGICMNDTIEVYVHIAGKSAPYTIEFSTGQIIDSIYYPTTFVPVEIGLTDINLEWGGETYFEDTITEATLSNHEWGQCIVKPVEFYTPSTWGPQQLQITVTDAYGESKTITKEIFAIQCPSVNVSANVSYDANIYPNPIKDKLFIDIPQNINPIYAEIYNSLGQLMKSNTLLNNIFAQKFGGFIFVL